MKHEIQIKLRRTFENYSQCYRKELDTMGFIPWCRDNKSIHESNQVAKFMEAYKSISSDPAKVITWMELPIPVSHGRARPLMQHIDGFIVDNELRTLFFIEAKRLSRKDRVCQLKEDIERIFSIRKEIYHGDGSFRGIDLFGYDAFVIALADVWMKDDDWHSELSSDWRSWCDSNLSTIHGSPECGELSNILRDYFLGYSALPIFDSGAYRSEIDQLNDPESQWHKQNLIAKEEYQATGRHKPGEDVSILAWSDEIAFERLLARLNWIEDVKSCR